MNKYRVPIILIFVVLLAGIGIFAIVEKRDADKTYRNTMARHYFIFDPEIPAKIDFSGENVPLNLFYVRESFEREIVANTYMHSSTILMFKRAYRWFPVIEPILKRNGVPDDFKFLALAESNLANVVSPAGAEGFWQFIKATGQKYGLEINEEVDERYNIEKSTEAACRYFKDSYDEYKSWTLVAASFNRGLDGISKALEKQKVTSYYDLFLNDETARYAYRILAIKQIYNNPAKYGFYLRLTDFYPPIPTYTVKIDSGISDLPAFALGLKINYRILREFNPWLRRYSLPNKPGKTYQIILPKEGYQNYDALLKSLPHEETFFHDTLKIDELH